MNSASFDFDAEIPVRISPPAAGYATNELFDVLISSHSGRGDNLNIVSEIGGSDPVDGGYGRVNVSSLDALSVEANDLPDHIEFNRQPEPIEGNLVGCNGLSLNSLSGIVPLVDLSGENQASPDHVEASQVPQSGPIVDNHQTQHIVDNQTIFQIIMYYLLWDCQIQPGKKNLAVLWKVCFGLGVRFSFESNRVKNGYHWWGLVMFHSVLLIFSYLIEGLWKPDTFTGERKKKHESAKEIIELLFSFIITVCFAYIGNEVDEDIELTLSIFFSTVALICFTSKYISDDKLKIIDGLVSLQICIFVNVKWKPSCLIWWAMLFFTFLIRFVLKKWFLSKEVRCGACCPFSKVDQHIQHVRSRGNTYYDIEFNQHAIEGNEGNLVGSYSNGLNSTLVDISGVNANEVHDDVVEASQVPQSGPIETYIQVNHQTQPIVDNKTIFQIIMYYLLWDCQIQQGKKNLAVLWKVCFGLGVRFSFESNRVKNGYHWWGLVMFHSVLLIFSYLIEGLWKPETFTGERKKKHESFKEVVELLFSFIITVCFAYIGNEVDEDIELTLSILFSTVALICFTSKYISDDKLQIIDGLASLQICIFVNVKWKPSCLIWWTMLFFTFLIRFVLKKWFLSKEVRCGACCPFSKVDQHIQYVRSRGNTYFCEGEISG